MAAHMRWSCGPRVMPGAHTSFSTVTSGDTCSATISARDGGSASAIARGSDTARSSTSRMASRGSGSAAAGRPATPRASTSNIESSSAPSRTLGREPCQVLDRPLDHRDRDEGPGGGRLALLREPAPVEVVGHVGLGAAHGCQLPTPEVAVAGAVVVADAPLHEPVGFDAGHRVAHLVLADGEVTERFAVHRDLEGVAHCGERTCVASSFEHAGAVDRDVA